MKTKNDILQVLTAAFVACLLLSNVMAAKQFEFYGVVLTSGAILFPVVYIINDVMAEIFGYKKARRVILTGFAINAFAVVAYNLAIILPAPAYASESAAAFALTLGNTWRVLLASFAAYLAGSLSNAFLMDEMRRRGGGLLGRCMLSTLVGESLDGVLFVLIAFAGVLPLSAVASMIVAQIVFKTALEFVFYPITRKVIKRIEVMA